MKRHPRFGRSASRRNQSKLAHKSLTLESLENRQLLAADLVSISPLDNATGVPVDSNLVLTFSDPVQAGPGAGRLLIFNAADDSLVEAISIKSDRVTFDGATVTVDPVNPLPAGAKLYISIDPGAIRDTSSTKGSAVLFSENFETSPMFDSPLDKPSLDDYAIFLTGTLDVLADGKSYRFGVANDDGGYLAIDLSGDGVADINDPADVVIFDNTTHGVVDMFAETSIALAKGQYKFEYMYFDRSGGSAGEFFYALDDGTLPDPIAFDASKFAVVGDASKGIGVTEPGIKATLYKAIAGTQVPNIETAQGLLDGSVELEEGYPKEAIINTADIWDSGSTGHFPENNTLPGLDVTDLNPRDYNDQLPPGWTKEKNFPQNPQPVYDGWTQLDKQFWITEQGNQARDTWELGQGVVLVMDPDAFDDYLNIDGVEPADRLRSFATLPPIDLSNVTANSVKLDFDSSFRPEAPRLNDEEPTWIGQTGLVDVSFDGGTTWENVLLQNQETAGGTGSLLQANEHWTLDVPNPSGGTMLVRFAIVNAQNDWWWAVDNIQISGEVLGDTYEGITNNRETWNFETASVSVVPGDVNGDGKVDLTDFNILKDNFGKSPATRAEGDLDGNGTVDLSDFNQVKDNFGKGGVAAVATPPDVLYAAAVNAAFRSLSSGGDDGGDADPFADDSL